MNGDIRQAGSTGPERSQGGQMVEIHHHMQQMIVRIQETLDELVDQTRAGKRLRDGFVSSFLFSLLSLTETVRCSITISRSRLLIHVGESERI